MAIWCETCGEFVITPKKHVKEGHRIDWKRKKWNR